MTWKMIHGKNKTGLLLLLLLFSCSTQGDDDTSDGKQRAIPNMMAIY
ncbi:MAG: hypothetical protein PHT17_05355 [Proteiniphilum sp.]|nr:hypothetical protein [Proteiniphilum sp.]